MKDEGDKEKKKKPIERYISSTPRHNGRGFVARQARAEECACARRRNIKASTQMPKERREVGKQMQGTDKLETGVWNSCFLSLS